MLTPTSARIIRIIAAMMIPTALFTGDHMDDWSITLSKIAKPTSTTPEGDRRVPRPVALPPICRKLSIIDLAKFGPLVKSHQKNPVNIVNLTTSAKNSPMSALRKAIIPNVQTMEIRTSSQNSHDAELVMEIGR